MTTNATRPGSWGLRQRVRVSGGVVAADVFGEGPPVLLVHGTPAWSFLWRGVVPLLARTHAVHVWDLLGFGDSRLRPGVRPSIAAQARALAELVAHWGLEAPTLVGHDIGGGIVARAHLTEGVRARRLALLDAAVLGPWNTPFTEHMQRHADVYRTMPTEVFQELIAGRLRTATRNPMADETADAYLAPWAGTAGQGRWIDQVSSVSFEDTRHAAARLEQIAVPTLVLWGAQDEWLGTATADRLAASIPGACEARVEGAGHFVAEDDPQATADALLEFLAAPVA
ncbi:haloalkane dehalogenase [Streptomyces abyssalis]|uniref:Haloalkane dehalogenase n=1 Tax=Streptomyces abyssalis TaxID=933944 RepID=A0A1E7JPS9_9ACTN|nr:alpha/beta hydrolase [Streptomyces abyssalis]OEU90292.1 haloalkane dehalogenase [Streptomyces abyssalis]OEU95027.1 haloalkane dehalogenase [Streptomyces abyssalis]OEV27973.1 haloalkane dehalogenase [Streptomyces nanshensis]